MINIMIIILFSLSIPIYSQVSWEKIDGPYGGQITYKIKDNDGNILVSTMGNGIFITKDEGISWTQTNSGIDNKNIIAVKQAPNGDYYCISTKDLYRSSVDGNNWVKIYHTTYLYIGDVAIGVDNSIYLTFYGNGGSLSRSTDLGITWQQIFFYPQFLYNVLVANDGTILVFGDYHTIFRSTDNGQNFQSSKLFEGSFGSTQIPLEHNSLGFIFVGTSQNGLYRSTNNGLNWQRINTSLPSLEILDIYVDQYDKIYILIKNGIFGEIYYSNDNGINWTKSFAFDRSDNYWDKIIVGDSENYYLGGTAGLYKTSDHGTSWDQMGLVFRSITAIYSKDNKLYAAGYIDGADRNEIGGDAIFYRENNKWHCYKNLYLSWEVKSIENSPFGVIYSGGSSITGIPSGGVFGINNSVHWGSSESYGGGGITQAIASFNNAIYAGAENIGVYKIQLENYTENNFNLTNKDVLSLTSNANYLFAGTNGGGVYRTSSNNWLQINTGIDNNYWVNALISDNNNTIFAGMAYNGGIYKSTNNGDNWSFSGLDNSTVKCFAVSSSNELFAATEETVYYSTDNGNTWNQIFPALFKVNSITVDNNGYLYVGTNSGIFVNDSPLTDIEKNHSLFPTDFHLSQNYPNPFNPKTIINYSVPKLSHVKILVYDIIGNEVAEIVNKEQMAGNYSAEFDASNLSSGVYFYRLTTGNFSRTMKCIFLK